MHGVGNELLGGRYRLVEELGAGGMSVVWRGYDEVLGRQVAIKVLAAKLASERSFRHRLRVEAKAAARLIHPHITNVYDFGENWTGGVPVPYVVMELVDGQSLEARLGRYGALPWRHAVAVCAEVASALAAAHARGVVHRDVTPGNVMLTATGAKVVDFGISALAGESDTDPDGKLLGTPAYLAPERLDAGQVSTATDVYALGLLLYRCLAGRLPWEADTTTQMLRNHRHADPAPLPPVDGLPDEVADLVRRCLAKTPADRPTSAEVARTLATTVGLAGIVPVSPAPVGAAGDADGSLALAGTTILPGAAATGVLPASTGTPAPGPVRRWWSGRTPGVRRRVGAAMAGAAMLAVTGVGWAASTGSPATGDEPTSLAMGNQPAAACQVDYALRSDSGRAFDAELTLTNDGRVRQGWTLTFALPGDQTMVHGEPVAWRQAGRDVVVRPPAGTDALPAGAAVKITLTGTYATANALPVRFHLDGEPCEVRVSGVAGQQEQVGGAVAGANPQGAAPPPATADSGRTEKVSDRGSGNRGNGNKGNNGNGNNGNGNGNGNNKNKNNNGHGHDDSDDDDDDDD
ncbi:protein kinase domain-containing protein [Polymorphospora sp. A560]|uniref:protein kinase domain-containing protein n=1 Tax=Polymorphospora sp. A560 TaxID=3040203 RepID=UPI00389183AC